MSDIHLSDEEKICHLVHLCCWLAKVATESADCRTQALAQADAENARDYLRDYFPVIQGSYQQQEIRELGTAEIEYSLLTDAVAIVRNYE
ncbi:MAG: hypothetical protein AAGD09_03170 [Cyanobacteria bacterium P01_F01_bin.56]